MSQINSVNIRPGVNVLSILPHLNYKAWFALAEFVDNSIQSSIDNKRDLQDLSGGPFVLRVDIDFDSLSKRITISDNAGGIASLSYQRAFRPAEIPPDASGLSEFGMGMKSAACWFAPDWSVRSSAIGESVERMVFFDISQIVHDSIEEIDVITTGAAKDRHYTEIRLENIRKFPRGKTILKIKEHLGSIYRVFFRKGQLELFVDGEKLEYEEPKILEAKCYRTPDGPSVKWKKEIDIDLGDGKFATGFVAIRETANTRLAGLALFRRNRLVLGSADDAYRPEDIFGRSNTYPYQRLFGEIQLRGFFVSHTKDGIKWEESEDTFLSKLRKELSKDELPLIQQAREHRTKSGARASRKVAASALQSTAASLQGSKLIADGSTDPTNTGEIIGNINSPEVLQNSDINQKLNPVSSDDSERVKIDLHFRSEPWVVSIELSYEENDADWLSIQDKPSIQDPEPRQILVRVSMLHPFMAQFPTLDSDGFSAVLSIAAAMALSEVVATELANRNPTAIRGFLNEILRTTMSKRIAND